MAIVISLESNLAAYSINKDDPFLKTPRIRWKGSEGLRTFYGAQVSITLSELWRVSSGIYVGSGTSICKGVDKWGLRGLKPPRFLTKLSVGETKRKETKFCWSFEFIEPVMYTSWSAHLHVKMSAPQRQES